MRSRWLLCCFGKEHAESEVQLAMEGMHSPQPSVSRGDTLSVVILEGQQLGKQVLIPSQRLLTSPIRFGTSPDAEFPLIPEEGLESLHFQIAYDSLLSQYLLQDLGAEAGVFIRLDSSIVIESELTISFGDVVVELEVLDAKGIAANIMEREMRSGSRQWTEKDAPVQFGRMSDCEVRFEDAGLSRYQCRLLFSENCWFLHDGDGQKPSTNGTWVMVRDSYPLLSKTVFKAGRVLFEAVPAS